MARNQVDGRERGFAAMDDEKQRAIARKGGQAVSENRQHIAEIGRLGGEARGRDTGDRQRQGNS